MSESLLDLTEYVDKNITDMTVAVGRYVGTVTSASEVTTDYGTSYVVSVDLDTRLDENDVPSAMRTATGAADVRTVVDWMQTRNKDGKPSKAVFKAVVFMRALGIDVKAGGKVMVNLNAWVGERVGVAVAYEEYPKGSGTKRQRLTPFAAPATAANVQSAVAGIASTPNVPPVPPVVQAGPVPPVPPVVPPAAQAQTPVPEVQVDQGPSTDDLVAQLRAAEQALAAQQAQQG